MANEENLTSRGRGRPKGAENKMTRAVKDVIASAAEELGGQSRLVAWVREDPKNESAFWTTIYPKLLPKEVSGLDGRDLFPQRVELVAVEPEAQAK